jgi:hypothetical protein
MTAIAAVPNAGIRIRLHPNGEKADIAGCLTASAGPSFGFSMALLGEIAYRY